MQYGHKVDQKLTDALNQILVPKFLTGENPIYIGKASNLSPSFDVLAITNFRILGINSTATDGLCIKREILRQEVIGQEIGSGFKNNDKLLVKSTSGETVVFGIIPKKDHDLVISVLQTSDAHPISDEVQAQHVAQSSESGLLLDPSIELIGGKPNAKTIRVVNESCLNGELPRFIIAEGAAGVLAAWSDRLMIIKTGGMTSFMAGATGGGRISTFYYKDINAIEYNSGFVTGVLEVLTASYNGTQNSDFWGQGKDDPWKLSNCLPLAKANHALAAGKLQELRKWISDAKNQSVIVHAPNSSLSLADEIKKLADLHAAGLLTEEELSAAKSKLLSQ